jgi:hypothetical protein
MSPIVIFVISMDLAPDGPEIQEPELVLKAHL